MRSMTGYGHGQTISNGTRYSVELNSVNRKQSEVVVTLPRELTELEPRVRDTINAEISRGRLTVVISPPASATAATGPSRDLPLARAWYQAMVSLQEELGASGAISIETVL